MLVKRIAAYPSIFDHLRAIARYWSEIATFSYPLHLTQTSSRNSNANTPNGVRIIIPGKGLDLRKLES